MTVPVFLRAIAAAWLAMWLLLAAPAAAQDFAAQKPNRISAQLVLPGLFESGQTRDVALVFDPAPGWHGYWKNPGDAGFGMTLDWQLPEGWSAGEPRYPVPETLMIGGLMNHVYNGPYTVLVPITAGPNASVANIASLAVQADWLACTDAICVPEKARLVAQSAPGSKEQFAEWQRQIPPTIDQLASFEVRGDYVRIGIPLPASLGISAPHLFAGKDELIDYAAVQTFSSEGDLLIAEIPAHDRANGEPIEGVLAYTDGTTGDRVGVRFLAQLGEVPQGSVKIASKTLATPPLWTLILGALAGGLLLNIMPCVFPILSLKAMALVRAGGSESAARSEGIAYTAGVVIACLALGAVLLALRAAGEQIGWAFQLQEPGIVLFLLVLAAVVTANFAGLFELPNLPITRSGEPAGAFATGLLAAFAATPCTGPFMAAALGAALLLPPAQAMLLFGLLGLGLALPFLLLGFVPALRKMLPRPGPWMETFRRIMAIPMGLTALALIWLSWRLGGWMFALVAVLLAIVTIAAFQMANRAERAGKNSGPALVGRLAIIAVLAAIVVPRPALLDNANSYSGVIDAKRFSTSAIAAARTSGKPVFVWMTADWCVTCKVNEGIAIEREAVRDAFQEADVTVLRGDWTQRDPEITEFLTEKGAAGVPLYVWISADGTEQTLPQILTPDSLINLAVPPQPANPPPPQADLTAGAAE